MAGVHGTHGDAAVGAVLFGFFLGFFIRGGVVFPRRVVIDRGILDLATLARLVFGVVDRSGIELVAGFRLIGGFIVLGRLLLGLARGGHHRGGVDVGISGGEHQVGGNDAAGCEAAAATARGFCLAVERGADDRVLGSDDRERTRLDPDIEDEGAGLGPHIIAGNHCARRHCARRGGLYAREFRRGERIRFGFRLRFRLRFRLGVDRGLGRRWVGDLCGQ